MKIQLMTLALGLGLSGSLGAAALPAAAAEDVQAAIQSVYDAQCTARKAGDGDTAAKSIADDFTGADPDGKKEDRTTTIASRKGGLAQANLTGCATKIANVDQKGV